MPPRQARPIMWRPNDGCGQVAKAVPGDALAEETGPGGTIPDVARGWAVEPKPNGVDLSRRISSRWAVAMGSGELRDEPREPSANNDGCSTLGRRDAAKSLHRRQFGPARAMLLKKWSILGALWARVESSGWVGKAQPNTVLCE